MLKNIMLVVLVGFMAMSCSLFGEKNDDSGAVQLKEKVTAAWISETVYSYKCGEWELQVEYLLKGRRSEGQDGKLLKGGKPVDPEIMEKVLETSLGKMKYYGSERKTKWAFTGWNFADRRKAKGSAALPAKKDEK